MFLLGDAVSEMLKHFISRCTQGGTADCREEIHDWFGSVCRTHRPCEAGASRQAETYSINSHASGCCTGTQADNGQAPHNTLSTRIYLFFITVCEMARQENMLNLRHEHIYFSVDINVFYMRYVSSCHHKSKYV